MYNNLTKLKKTDNNDLTHNNTNNEIQWLDNNNNDNN